MSNEEHLAENAINAYKNSKDYFEGLKKFDCEKNRKMALAAIGSSYYMASIYEIIISAYDRGVQRLRDYLYGEEEL